MGKIWLKISSFFIIVLFFGCSQTVKAQRIAIKTNAFEWLTASPNLSAELTLSRRYTMDLSVAVNPADFGALSKWGVRVQPDLRYWFHRPMTRLFVGVCGVYGENHFMLQGGKPFNKKEPENFNYYAGAGPMCGYAWIIDARWNMEVFGGVGILHYRKAVRGSELEVENKTTVAPIKLGFSLSYIIR